ncbi:hypothetical protein PC128_g18166 [Phytophthora cactorum]|nr:hypothetical protein PC128_g18166 [Phytophthora cactorum]
MSLKNLAQVNTKRARESAARSFLKFIEDEGVTWEYLEVCMQRENAALLLAAVVDKFGMYLAFKEGRKGQLLARYSVMQYYRQAKNWLLEKFPQHRAAIEKTLLTKGQVLERYCMKRESGVFVNKAPACTKKGLKQMIEYLYSTANTSGDYNDAALLVYSGDIFFVRFIRVKTSEEQGLSLCLDDDFVTCPLLVIALALITQSSPTAAMLNQLPEHQAQSQTSLTPATPLIILTDHPEDVPDLQVPKNRSPEDKQTDSAPGIHNYVNRVLDRVAKKAGVAERLTSHSFRRGGAQHANGAGMCVQWIFDRGAWNMTAANKAFAYVFSTPSEDHKVARVLSSHDPEKAVLLLSLDAFDSETQVKIRSVASAFFTASSGLEMPQYNVNERVLDT